MSPVILTDRECVELSKSDDRYFEILVDRYEKPILSFVEGECDKFDRSIVEDIVQETFIRAWKNLEDLEQPHRFCSWLRGIARHVAHEKYREMQKIMKAEKERAVNGTAGSNHSPHEPVDVDDTLKLLDRSIARLPIELRRVIHLRFFKNLTYKEISKTLGVSTSTVHYRVTKALKRLRYPQSKSKKHRNFKDSNTAEDTLKGRKHEV